MITTKTTRPSLAAVVRGDEVQVGSALMGVVAARNLSAKNAGAVALVCKDSAEFTNGYSQWILAGEDASLTNGGAAAIVAGGETSIKNGGAALVLAGNGLKAEHSGAGALITGKADIHGGFVGLVVSGKTAMGEGTRVLLGTRQVVMLGVVLALVLRLFGLRRR